MKNKPKLTIGMAFYGQQEPEWWMPLAMVTGTLHKIGVDFQGMLGSGSMLADSNRNTTVDQFLQTKSEWLLWLDTDNIALTGGIKRLLDCNRTLVSGLYFSKKEPFNPIAYYRLPTGMYRPLEENDYTRGEIMPVSAAGMGALLTHRSVYEDMSKFFTVLQTDLGGYMLIENDKIKGKIDSDKRHGTDGKVIGGQLRTRLMYPHTPPKAFPYFRFDGGRTEDMPFFENAAVAGHKLWLDTSVEEGHLRKAVVSGETRRLFRYRIKTKEVSRSPRDTNVEVHLAEVEHESS